MSSKIFVISLILVSLKSNINAQDAPAAPPADAPPADAPPADAPPAPGPAAPGPAAPGPAAPTPGPTGPLIEYDLVERNRRPGFWEKPCRNMPEDHTGEDFHDLFQSLSGSSLKTLQYLKESEKEMIIWAVLGDEMILHSDRKLDLVQWFWDTYSPLNVQYYLNITFLAHFGFEPYTIPKRYGEKTENNFLSSANADTDVLILSFHGIFTRLAIVLEALAQMDYDMHRRWKDRFDEAAKRISEVLCYLMQFIRQRSLTEPASKYLLKYDVKRSGYERPRNEYSIMFPLAALYRDLLNTFEYSYQVFNFLTDNV